MKMWSMKVIILLLFCYASLSTDNQRVKFVSRNFYNVLQWDPVEPAFPGENVTYSVQYWSDVGKEPFQKKEACQNTTALSCDLTAVTPSVHDVHYWARVLVNGRPYGTTNSFKPLAETLLDPPALTIHTTTSSLHINASLPTGPNGVSLADIIMKSKNGPSKTVVDYILKITHPKWAVHENKTKTGRFVINLKNNQSEYCGYVVYRPDTEWGRSDSESAPFCVTLPGDPLKLLPWLLLGAALLAAVVITSVVCVCNYVKGGKEKSMQLQQLVTTFSSPNRVLQPSDINLVLSKPVICTQSDQTVYTKIQVNRNVPSVGSGGYSPQDIPGQAWQGSFGSSGARSSTPNEEDTSAQSSEIYSVVAVHVPEDNDFRQDTVSKGRNHNLPFPPSGESWGQGGKSPKLISRGAPTLPDPDCDPAGPLLLRAVRDPNGQLILPLDAFQLQSSTGDTERRPLLSDLIDSRQEGPSLASLQSFDCSEWSDSGCEESSLNTTIQPYCNTHYLQQGCQNTPSTDATFDSGYKQNWMPAILLGNASKDGCEYRRTDCAWTWTGPKKVEEGEEKEDREGEETSVKILLGDWAVQIQD